MSISPPADLKPTRSELSPAAVPSAAEVERGRDLGGKIARGTAWNFAGTITERLMAFGVFALVVRHLAASEVGVVTLAAIFVDLSLVMTHGGLPEALVRHQSPTERTFDTAFWTNMGLGTVLTLILCALALPIGALYHTPALPPVLFVLSGVFILTALGTVHQARLTRAFHFRSLAMRSIAATAIGGAAAIAMSLEGYGLWALVAQRLVTVAISTVSLWLAARWLPRLHFDRAQCRELLGFGVRLTASTILLQLTSTVSLLIIGYAMNNAAVGYYRVAGRLYDMVNQFVVAPVSQVALAAFAAVQSDEQRFAGLYARLTGVVAVVAIATFAGMAALAGPLVALVFGAGWGQSAPILAVLCLTAAPFCVNIFVWPALTARGAANDVMRFGVVQLLSGAIFAAVAAPFGALAVAWGQVARAFVVLPYALRLTARHAGAGPKALLKPLLAPVLAASLMAAALVGLQYLFPHAGTGERLGIGIPLGMALYVGFLTVISPHRLQDAVETVRQARRARADKPA